MLDKIDTETAFAALAASGGIARIVAGVNADQKISLIGEIARVLFAAMPIGVITGCWVQTKTDSEVLPYAACFTAGVISLNIVRFMLSAEGLKLFRNLIGGNSGK